MSVVPCPTPCDDRHLVEYWLGELAHADAAALEDHLLGCAACSARLDALVQLGGQVREVLKLGQNSAFLTDDFVQRLAASGLRVREYRVACHGSVLCRVAPEDDLIVGRLDLPDRNVSRIDLVLHIDGYPDQRSTDIPFDHAHGAVLLVPHLAQLRAMPSHTQRIELFSVSDEGEHLIGDYTFHHRAPDA